MNKTGKILCAAVLGLLLTPSLGIAAEPTTNSLDRIITLYQQNASRWEATLTTYALSLFWILAAIEMAYMAIRLVVRGSDFSEWLTELVNQILFIGFFLTLLQNSSVWARAIVDSFRTAANQAVVASGGTSLIAPSDIFGVGLGMANKLYDQASIWSPGASLILAIFALVLLICFALIASFLILALVESYIVISAGVLFMGFGGSRFTKDVAVKMILYAFSVGAKLFVLQLIIGLGQQIFNSVAQNFEANSSDVLVATGSAIVMLAVTKIIPEMIQGLVNGVSVTSGALGAYTYATAYGAVKEGAGTAFATRSANRLASEQLTDAAMTGQGGPGRAVRLAGNLAKGSVDTLGARLSGRAHFGTFAGQTSEMIQERARGRQFQRQEEQKLGPEGSVTGSPTKKS